MSEVRCLFDNKQYIRRELERKLSDVLVEIITHYTDYDYRFKLVIKALSLSKDLDYSCGFRLDPQEPEWPVVVIVLPNIGEVSFHMPPSGIKYDGSGQKEQKQRIYTFRSNIN